jgi:hypothetical protein
MAGCVPSRAIGFALDFGGFERGFASEVLSRWRVLTVDTIHKVGAGRVPLFALA